MSRALKHQTSRASQRLHHIRIPPTLGTLVTPSPFCVSVFQAQAREASYPGQGNSEVDKQVCQEQASTASTNLHEKPSSKHQRRPPTLVDFVWSITEDMEVRLAQKNQN